MVGGGLADIWVTSERSVPMSVFTFAAVFGTIAAPVYSGFILAGKGWRWIQCERFLSLPSFPSGLTDLD